MLYIKNIFTTFDKKVFIFTGKIEYIHRCEGAKDFMEIYDFSDTLISPPRLVCKVIIYTDNTAVAKLFDCPKDSVNNILNSELSGFNIEYEDANYYFDRNKWLLSFVEDDDIKIMRIDDEYLTFDGVYLYMERIFHNNILTEVREYYRDTNGEIKWEAERYVDD
jgi:hypothetical protein